MNSLRKISVGLLCVAVGILFVSKFYERNVGADSTSTCSGGECPTICGDALWNTDTEECDYKCDASHSTDTCPICDTSCKCVANTCGDGYLLTSKEECEKYVSGVSNWAAGSFSCLWEYDDASDSYCNHATCKCTTNTCGDGVVVGDEECEIDSDCADGKTCSNCACVSTSTTCGNGTKETGEECETSSDCKSGQTCTGCACITPTVPKTAKNYTNVLVWGVALLIIGLFFEPLTSFVNGKNFVIEGKVPRRRKS